VSSITTLADAGARRTDNFLPLRHLAAMLVIYGHSYALTRHPPGDADVLAKLMPGFYAGNFAVYLFFAISGFLVTLSLIRHPGPYLVGVSRYVRNRVLRVYPAYLACLLVCVFVIGAAFTTLPLHEYLRAEGTWQYLTRNLQPVTLAWDLPGVFEDNAYPKVVNGTLWSLSLEVRWYFYLGLLAALTIVRRRWAFSAVAVALVLFGAWEWWSGKPDVNEYRALSQTYLIAGLCAHWRARIPVSHWLMAGWVAVAALAHGGRWFGPAVVLGAIYFVLWAAYALPTLRWPGTRDYSYGLFLYAFPVQQSLVALFPDIPPLALLPTAATGALLLAAASWHWVEQPALQWKGARAGAVLPAV
jgi:peptidoglycan/LPS O-acetylase OafA/YrhL